LGYCAFTPIVCIWCQYPGIAHGENSISSCQANVTSGPSEYYVANVEDFQISIDHSPRTPNLGIVFTDTVTGQLDQLESGEANTWDTLREFNSLGSDYMNVPEFLSAARYDLDTEANGYLDPSQLENYRRFGGVILLMIYYTNQRGFVSNENVINYEYRPVIIPEIDDFMLETIWVNYPTEQIQLVRRGIRILAVMTGTLGKFDFQTLLIQLTASLTLVLVSKTIVDFLACYILPRRAAYYDCKYEVSEDYSTKFKEMKLKDLKDGLSQANLKVDSLTGGSDVPLQEMESSRSRDVVV